MKPVSLTFTLVLLSGCCGNAAYKADRSLTLVRHQGLSEQLVGLAPTWDRFAVGVPVKAGLKVWLEVDGKPTVRLGIRHEWESPFLPKLTTLRGQDAAFESLAGGHWLHLAPRSARDSAWILFRDVPLQGLARPHRQVEIVLVSGSIAADDRHLGGTDLLDPTAQSGHWVVPAAKEAKDPRRVLQRTFTNKSSQLELVALKPNGAFSTVNERLVPGKPVVLAEFPSTQTVRLMAELVAPSG